MIQDFRELVLRADYYTGATEFLKERATALGKVSYRIPNGLNQVQLELSARRVQEAWHSRDREQLRIGYFSGTLTHQADFRMIAPVLVRLLGEFPGLTLTVAGELDATQLPDSLAVRPPRGETPFGRLAATPLGIAHRGHQPHSPRDQSVHGRQSNLKYYESAIVEVPSVASPTVVYQSCIGLARTASLPEPAMNGTPLFEP